MTINASAWQAEVLADIEAGVKNQVVLGGRRSGKDLLAQLITPLQKDRKSCFDMGVCIVASRTDYLIRGFELFARQFGGCTKVGSLNRSSVLIRFEVNGVAKNVTFKAPQDAYQVTGLPLFERVIVMEPDTMHKSVYETLLSHTQQNFTVVGSGPRVRDLGVQVKEENMVGWKRYSAPTSANPYIDQDYLEDIRPSYHKELFTQVFEAHYGGQNA